MDNREIMLIVVKLIAAALAGLALVRHDIAPIIAVGLAVAIVLLADER